MYVSWDGVSAERRKEKGEMKHLCLQCWVICPLSCQAEDEIKFNRRSTAFNPQFWFWLKYMDIGVREYETLAETRGKHPLLLLNMFIFWGHGSIPKWTFHMAFVLTVSNFISWASIADFKKNKYRSMMLSFGLAIISHECGDYSIKNNIHLKAPKLAQECLWCTQNLITKYETNALANTISIKNNFRD